MKLLYIVVTCFFAVVVSVNEKEQKVWFAWILARAECQVETRVSDISLARSVLGEDVNDPKLREEAFCTLKKGDYINQNGELQEETIKKAIGDFFGEKTPLFYKKCLVEKDSPGRTSLDFILCFRRIEQTLDRNFGSGPKN